MIGSPRLRSALLGTYAALSVLYLAFRAALTLNPEHPVYAAVFFAAEAFCIAASLAFYKLVVRRADPPAAPPPERWPEIDVLIATFNEEAHLLRTTAVAARDVQGPHRTWICDDGRRPEVEALAREIGVGYIARPSNEHFKAGNLNHALGRTSGDLVLVLDADHVPRRGMLSRLVPLFTDPKVALVQTPQVYYNVDSYQHYVSARRRRLWHEATVFHHMMQPGAARLNAAFFVGTGALLRRSALEEIGGFATGSITEDIHTSMRLHARGWRSAYVDEALGFLLAPDTPFAFARQRLRWAQGAMQILRRESPLRKPGLSPWQRLGYVNSLAGYLAAFQHLIFYLAPGIFIMAGASPIAIDPALAFPIFAGHIAIDLALYKALAAPHARLFLGECYKMLTVALHVRASAALLRPEGLPFRVTPKGRHAGLPLALILPAAGLFLFNVTSVGIGIMRLARGDPHPEALLLTTFFAAQFSIAGALALVHAWERRGADEPFAFPVSIPAGEEVHVRRLNHGVAYAVTGGTFAPGDEVPLDLAAAGIPRPIAARVLAREAAPRRAAAAGAAVVKLSLAALRPEERDALDRYLFETALPRFLAGFRDAPPGPPPAPGPLEAEGGAGAESGVRGFLEIRGGIV